LQSRHWLLLLFIIYYYLLLLLFIIYYYIKHVVIKIITIIMCGKNDEVRTVQY